MPRNGSGQYDLPYNWNNDKANNIKVLASRMQGQDQDIATALTNSLAKDGQTPLTGDLDFNGNKIVDLGNGSGAQDGAAINQVQSGALQYFGVSSTPALGTDGEDYQVSPLPQITVYPAYIEFSFVAHYTCINAPQLQFDTLAQKALVKDSGAGVYTALVASDMVANTEYRAVYNEDVSSSQIIILNPETISGSVFDTLTTNNIVVNRTINGALFHRTPIISNNVSDPNNDIDFSAGGCFDQTNNVGFALGAITKRLDAAWSAGTGNGGLDTGSKANSTWYHCYAIYNPTTNTADAIFSTNASSPTLPSGYTRYSRLRASQILTDGSGNIIPFLSDGIQTLWTTVRQDLNVTNPGTSGVLRTLSVPLGIVTLPIASYTYGHPNASTIYNCLITGADQTDSAPSISLYTIQVRPAAQIGTYSGKLRTNTSSQIRTRPDFSNADTMFAILTYGWEDPNL